MSRFYAIKSGEDEMNDITEESDSMFEGLDESDPRSVARWARRMKDTMGEEMDLGPEFDRALDRIESGEILRSDICRVEDLHGITDLLQTLRDLIARPW